MKDAPKGAMPIGAPITDGDHTHNRPADLMSDSETTEMNEVAEAYANMRRRRIGRLKIALTEARRVDADEWAEIITLSEETGLSIDVVELEKDLIKQRLDEQGFWAGSISKNCTMIIRRRRNFSRTSTTPATPIATSKG